MLRRCEQDISCCYLLSCAISCYLVSIFFIFFFIFFSLLACKTLNSFSDKKKLSGGFWFLVLADFFLFFLVGFFSAVTGFGEFFVLVVLFGFDRLSGHLLFWRSHAFSHTTRSPAVARFLVVTRSLAVTRFDYVGRSPAFWWSLALWRSPALIMMGGHPL